MSLSRERNAFGTSKRENNSAHPLRKPPASDDFFSDSILESSRIPTPSPQKKKAKQAFASRPRREVGHTRTLKDAWDATARNGRPSSSGSEGYRLGGNFKPAPFQARRRSPAGPAESRSTPSPSRGRQASLSLASPMSDASSPPGGLNDVYQRIADEERLAAQEEEEEEDATNSTMSHESLPDDRARLNRIRSSQSPLNFRSSSRSTPQPQAADANKENQGDHTGLSHASGMSFLENMTDRDLAAKLTPHTMDRARDRARLDKAIHKNTPLAFSKAQVGSKHALTSENLQRSGRRDSSRSMHSSSNGSLRNEDITPPPNVPRTWGSKGRVDKDWMRKIHERNGSQANGTTKDKNHESSQIDWTTAAAEVPLPSIEDSFTPKPENSRNSTPPSLSKQTSLDRIRQWELNDFTGNNLQVSESPPVKVRTHMPDYFKDREIETLEKRAVTTNRLGEIRKKNSSEILTGKSRSVSGGARKEVEDQATTEKNEEILKIEEEGEPIPHTPIVVYKASVNGTKKDEEAKARPMHDRKDSRDDLQRLARAVSESPRPSATPEDWSLIKEEEAEVAISEDGRPLKVHDASRKSSKEVATSKRSQSADAARTPRVTGAWTDTILPDTVKTVKQGHAPAKYIQTPHVIGGWIDTPLPDGKRQSSAPAPILTEDLPKKAATNLTKGDSKASKKDDTDTKAVTKPPSSKLPPSALTSLITQAKLKRVKHSPITEEEEEEEEEEPTKPNNNNDTLTLNLGDATIESLEDLLTLDNTDMTTLIRMGAEFEARSRKSDGDQNPELGTELELLEHLGIKLERMRTNIHDVGRGISKLENQVSRHPDTDTATLINSASSACQTCGHHLHPHKPSFASSDSNLFLTIPIPRLYHKHQGQRLPRPTLLGYITLAIWLWYLIESVLWSCYGRPQFAEYYTWPREYGYWEPRWGRMAWMVGRWVLGWSGVDEVAGFNRTAYGAGGGGARGMAGAGVGVGDSGMLVGLEEDEFL